MLNSSCGSVNFTGTSGSGNVDRAAGLIELSINLRCGHLVFGVVESEVVFGGCSSIVGRSNRKLSVSGRNLRSLEGKIGALLVELG